jgi:hypothetical protein
VGRVGAARLVDRTGAAVWVLRFFPFRPDGSGPAARLGPTGPGLLSDVGM